MIEVEVERSGDAQESCDLGIVLRVFNFTDVTPGEVCPVSQLFLADAGGTPGDMDTLCNPFKQLRFFTLVGARSSGHLMSACPAYLCTAKYCNMHIIIDIVGAVRTKNNVIR